MTVAILGIAVRPSSVYARSVNATKPIPLVAIQANAHGVPLAHARVELFPLGEAVSSGGPIGLATTNGKGQAFLSFVPSAQELALAASNAGNLSFSVVVLNHGGPPDIVNFTKHIGLGMANGRGSSAYTVSPNRSPQTWAAGARLMAAGTVATQVVQPAGPTETCLYRYQTDGTANGLNTKVGELHNARDSTATFTYGTEADSSIEVGYSLTGDSNWTADGTITISNSLSASVSITRNSSQWYDTGYQLLSEFNYQRLYYYNVCVGYSPYYLVNATQWDGGMTVGAYVGGNDGNPNQYTAWFAPGTTFTRDQYSAWEYNAAVSTPWGASLTAQSGYSQYVRLHWSFAASAGYNQALYGNNNYPTKSPIIYAY